VPLDHERRWYRYHHLFAELLRARLNEQEPGLARGLHRRAAEWHERNGTVTSAVHHALHSGDPELAADTVERAIRALATWSSVEVNTVLGWLHALPVAVRRRRAWLMLFEARAQYITGQMDAARRTLKMLDAWLETHPEGPETAHLRAIMRADYASYAVVRGDTAEAIEYAGKALADVAGEDRSRQVRPAAILGLAYLRRGNVRAAVETLSEALDAALSTGQAFVAIPLYCNLAEARLLQGRLRQAQQACDKAHDLAESAERPLAVAGFIRLQLGKIAYEHNELAAAEAQVREALSLLGQGGITENFGSFYGVLALVLQALGKAEEASTTARRAVLLAQEEGIERLVNLAQAYEARVWLAQGALDRAEGWARLYRGLPPPSYLREFEDLTLVRLQLARGESEQAVTRLDALLAPALADGRQGRILEGNVLRAVALQQLGETAGALAALNTALELAEPEGYLRVFLEAGPMMMSLLSHAGAKGPHRAFIAALQTSGRQGRTPQAGAGTLPGQTRLVEPLTERELEVLALLARGLSNPEIAKQLVLSVHTVRSHAYNLYGKLNVHSRTQAVARARELALLPDD
jgi:LuxR family maltose regulon positive regulatory protein